MATCAALVVSCSSDEAVRADGRPDGRVVEAGNASVFELQPGDCFDPAPGDTGEVATVPLVPCDEPHTQEVFALVRHPDDSYPGATALAAFADGRCLDELQAELELTLDDGVFLSYLLPTFDGWSTGDDRQIVCVLLVPGQETITGSFVAGTAQLDRRDPDPPATPDAELDADGASAEADA